MKSLQKLLGGKPSGDKQDIPVIANIAGNTVTVKSPLGIFWDIENCPIPYNKSPSDVAKHIRDHIDVRHPECGYAKEFYVAADIRRIDPHICESLDRNGVVVVHVNGAAKNAADDKLQELMDMFVDKFGAGAVLTVITGDINFVRTIRNARRKDVVVVLIHGLSHSQDLKSAANEVYLYDDVIRGAETITQIDKQLNPAYLKVSNLPKGVPSSTVINRLSQLSANCGGKVESVDGNGEEAVIRFGCKDDAQRAAQRMAGVDCFGHKIDVKLMDGIVPKTAPIKTRARSQDRSKVLTKSSVSIDENDIKSKSVIKGLPFTSEDKVIQLVRMLVNGWADKQINGNLIANVEGKGKSLFVTAVNPDANQKLLAAARQHIRPESGVKWKVFKTKRRDLSLSRAKSMNEDNLMSNVGIVGDDPQCKSVIKGLFTKMNDNPTDLVRKLVSDWNDPQIKPDFISSVTRGGKGEGKNNLFVMANSPLNNHSLITAATKHFKDLDGIKWEPYGPKSPVKLNETKVLVDTKVEVNNNAKTGQNDDINCKSVIKGLTFKKDENLVDLVRKLVRDWKDPQINPNTISFVTLGGKGKLFVTATSAHNNNLIVSAVKRHLKDSDDIKWYKFTPKPKPNASKASNASKADPKGTKYDEMTCKSVIIGMETKKDENVGKAVRKLVMSWSDNSLNGNQIVDVKRDAKFADKDGKALLFVMAINPEASIALVNGANVHLGPNCGLKWSHYKPKDRQDSEVDTKSTVSDVKKPRNRQKKVAQK